MSQKYYFKRKIQYIKLKCNLLVTEELGKHKEYGLLHICQEPHPYKCTFKSVKNIYLVSSSSSAIEYTMLVFTAISGPSAD